MKIQLHTKAFLLGLLLSVFYSQHTNAQELNFKVTINADQLRINQQRGETQIFDQLQNTIAEFLNGRKWGNDAFASEEKIKGNITINLIKATANGDYEGNANIQIIRPIFNTSYETPLLRFVDRSFNFNFLPTKPLNYNDNVYSDNLTSIMAFYAYVALAVDYDSFSKAGGTAYIQKAYNVVNLAQSSGDNGWDAKDVRNRYALAENLQNQQMMPLREAFYTYHRLVMDNFVNEPDEARRQVINILNDIKTVNLLKPGAVFTNSFFDTKGDEIINIFLEASKDDRQKVYNLLVNLDPTKTDNYKRLLR
jgi:hypothetical protein